MAQFNDTGYGTIRLTADVTTQHLRIKADGTIAGDEADIGTNTEVGSNGQLVAYAFKNKQGTTIMVAAKAIAAGASLNSVAGGKVTDAAGAAVVGVAIGAASGDNSQIEVLRT